MINIGITGTGSLIGQAIIKCINNSDYANSVELTGFDYFNETVGSYWCKNNFKLTDIYLNPEKENIWLGEIKQIINEKKLDFLFVGIDFELILFAKHKEYLENDSNVKIIVSRLEVIEIGNDKYKTYQFLKENNLTHPETSYFKDCDPAKITYPTILKPAKGARSRGVYVIENSDELIEKASTIKEPIVQELIGVEDDEYTCGTLVLDGKFISSIVLKRTLKDGNTSKAYYSSDFPASISSYIEQIAEKLLPFGSCNLQLRVDNKGIPKLFEINPRHSGTTFMRTQFGYNEVEMILHFYLKGEISPPVLKEGVVIRYFTEMFQEW